MQIQSASIPISPPQAKPNQAAKSAPPEQQVQQAKAAKEPPSKPDARPNTQDTVETARNTQFAPVSAPTASTSSNASLATNRDGTSSRSPINSYQQMAKEGQTNEKNAQSDLFGVDVYV
jgi:hypothetical protein